MRREKENKEQFVEKKTTTGKWNANKRGVFNHGTSMRCKECAYKNIQWNKHVDESNWILIFEQSNQLVLYMKNCWK